MGGGTDKLESLLVIVIMTMRMIITRTATEYLNELRTVDEIIFIMEITSRFLFSC